MAVAETSDIVKVLQTAVTPVVMISGVGLLLLTMTNRFGRLVDRARSLAARLRDGEGGDLEPIRAQLHILARRGRLLRRSIAEAGFCVLFAALLIITLFITMLAGHEVEWLIAAWFILSLVFLILSLIDFIRDVYRALEATALEVGKEWEEEKK
jgi:cobalamin biosynthesis protein CobD/CbiB